MTPDAVVAWNCCTKIATTVLVAKLWEQGQFGLDDPVCDHVPRFRGNGKQNVTIRHLLTHTAGFDDDPAAILLTESWERTLDAVCSAPLRRNWVPGLRAAYSINTAWFLLAEVMRMKGYEPGHTEKEHVFQPLSMRLSALSSDAFPKYIPGNSGCGPMRELARLCELLLQGGSIGGTRLLTEATCREFTSVHRTGVIDEVSRTDTRWGLGLAVDGRAFGQFCSPKTFGHLGAQTTMVFADPDEEIVAGIYCDGTPGETEAMIRRYSISEALYKDLSSI